MDMSYRGPDYEVPKVTVDGEPHEIIVLVAIVTGAILASIILIILITLIERTKKKQPILPENTTKLEKAPSTDSFYQSSTALNRSISTISDRVSMRSERSYCSGIVIDGQVRCCQKALEIVGKSTSEISISSGISSGSDTTFVTTETQSHISTEREYKMTTPKTVTGMKQREVSFVEIVTKC